MFNSDVDYMDEDSEKEEAKDEFISVDWACDWQKVEYFKPPPHSLYVIAHQAACVIISDFFTSW